MTSHLAVRAAVGGLQTIRFKSVLHRSEERKGDRDIDLLSLSSAGHLYPRTKESDRQQASDQSVARCLVVNPGDLVVNPMWLTGGSIAVSDRRGAVSPDYRVFRPSPAVWPRYVHHLLRAPAYMDQYRLYTRADTTFDRRVQQEDLDELPLPLPSIARQRRIADFLDDQVARIDNIINARNVQTQLRSEAVDAAVAEVFNTQSSVPLIRVVARWIDYRGATPSKVDSGVRLITASNIRDGQVDLATAEDFISESDYLAWMRRGFPEIGDILLTTEAPLGQVAQVTDASIALAQRVILIRTIAARVVPRWIYWWLRSPAGQSELWARATGSTAPGIKAERLRQVPIPLLPITEQARRVEWLNELDSDRRTFQELARTSVSRLRELKRSLITAAVTGEFDVSTADGSRVSV